MRIALLMGLLLVVPGMTPTPVGEGERLEVVFTGGHDTDPRDHGRPVVLIAGALGVPEQVFREAFSHVTPTRGGAEPEPEQVRRNKKALLQALGPYGVTNERLDEVSTYYRYSRAKGEKVWRSSPAAAFVMVRDGKVIGTTVANAGAGYSSVPTATVPGTDGLRLSVKLAFGMDLNQNGSIVELGTARAN